MVQIT